MPKTPGDFAELAFKLSTVFKPSTPINRQDLFRGRQPQIREIIDAIHQQGQHAVLYGERGVGKTSLANMIFPKLEGFGKLTPLVNCMTQDNYGDIWRRVFEEIKFIVDEKGIEITETARHLLTDFTDQHSVQIAPDEVRRLLYELGQDLIVVVILDEFDTIANDQVRAMMSDTLKFLSDRSVPATVILVGVADDVESLVKNHRSLERCLLQVHMPRMSKAEVQDIVSNGLASLGMTITAPALDEICHLSKGLPPYPHLLGLHSGRAALDESTVNVTVSHIDKAVSTAIQKTQASIQTDYLKAITSSRQESLYRQVLLACALSRTDEAGWFYAKDIRNPLQIILGHPYKIESYARHLHAFCSEARGPVLIVDTTSARPRFRFENPLVQPDVLLRGLAEKMITIKNLKAADSAS